MLPDFESMTRVSLVDVFDGDVRRGIETHHRTDDAFHRGRVFLGLCSRALEVLSDASVRRGTARAVGHIATEMFLDGLLAERSEHVDDYLAALEAVPPDALRWEDSGRAFETLQSRLMRWGAPLDYRDPDFVLARLEAALRLRPRLAMTPEDVPRVARSLPALEQQVRLYAEELLDELQDALGFGR
jgi:hypothetical protein